jgi:hypothetical protein
LPGNILLNPVAAKASDHTKSSSSPPWEPHISHKEDNCFRRNYDHSFQSIHNFM